MSRYGLPSTLLNVLAEVKGIKGPSQLTILDINSKMVFLFGDVHINTSETCDIKGYITLTEYLDIFFKQSPVCCDFFLENWILLVDDANKSRRQRIKSYIYKDSHHHELSILIRKYGPCIRSYRDPHCMDFGNVRFHNIDFRRFLNDSYNITRENVFSHITFKNSKYFVEHVGLYKDILIDLIDGHIMDALNKFQILYAQMPDLAKHYEHHKFLFDSDYPRLSKQFVNIPPGVKQHIKKKLITSYEQKTKNIVESNNIVYIAKYMVQVGIVYMDAYTISRMYKAIYEYSDSGIIFLYAGAKHTKFYVDILSTYADNIIYDSKGRLTLPHITAPPTESHINDVVANSSLIGDQLNTMSSSSDRKTSTMASASDRKKTIVTDNPSYAFLYEKNYGRPYIGSEKSSYKVLHDKPSYSYLYEKYYGRRYVGPQDIPAETMNDNIYIPIKYEDKMAAKATCIRISKHSRHQINDNLVKVFSKPSICSYKSTD